MQMTRRERVLASTILVLIIGLMLYLSAPWAAFKPPDLAMFLTSGRAWAAGGDPYPFPSVSPNLCPPVLLPLFAVMASFSDAGAWRIMYAASLLAIVMSWFILRPRADALTPLLLLASAGVWWTLGNGQVYALLLPFWVLGWREVPARPLLAGFFFGCVIAVKPQFILLIPFLALASWRAAGAVLFGAGGVTLLAVALLGFDTHMDWLRVLAMRAPVGGNVCVSLTATAGPAVAMIVALAALWAAWKRPWNALPIGTAIVLLVSPISWVGYTIFLLPAFTQRPLTKLSTLGLVLLLVPGPVVFDYTLTALYPVAVLLLLLDFGMYQGHRGVGTAVFLP